MSSQEREVVSVSKAVPTVEGAGVRLARGFGRADPRLDPFLLLDEFGSDEPDDYMAGFPWHPHRGIQTVTYMLAGRVAHGDSLGNRGEIGAGDVQWMTAGSGIVHEEMPQTGERLRGFQLWINLSAAQKMMSPRYQEISATELPVVEGPSGARAKLVCGTLWGATGPVDGVADDPLFADVTIPPGEEVRIPIPVRHNALVYGVDGDGTVGSLEAPTGVGRRNVLVFGDGDSIRAKAGAGESLRLLLIAGKPLREPVAWGGPIVMNTSEELEEALREYRSGTFLRHGSPGSTPSGGTASDDQ